MPYTASYVDGGKGVSKSGTGIVTGLEIFTSALQESRNTARPREIQYALVDFSQATDLKVTPEDIRRIVEVNRKLAVSTPNELVAVVAPDGLPYAMARLWHTLSDDLGWISNVFHTRPDAVAWLRKEIEARAGSGAVLEEFPFLRQEP
jgi:hypothetical protein